MQLSGMTICTGGPSEHRVTLPAASDLRGVKNREITGRIKIAALYPGRANHTFRGKFHVRGFIFCSRCVVLCFFLQRRCRKRMETTQYNYFRDLLLVAAWVLAALWAGSSVSRFIVGMAAFASLVGTCQHSRPHWGWKTAYLFVGFVFAVFGPKIGFIGLPDGQYHYFSPEVSIIVTALWVGIFPVLLQQLDNIPGMAGHLLAISFSLLLLATVFSGQDLPDAFFMSLCGLAFLGVFWSRHGHMYRRMGESLSALWGILVAGTSVLGVSKGIPSDPYASPLGLFAIHQEASHLSPSFLFLSSHGRRAVQKSFSRGLDTPAQCGSYLSAPRRCCHRHLSLETHVHDAVGQRHHPFHGLAIMPFIRDNEGEAEMPLKTLHLEHPYVMSPWISPREDPAAAVSGKGVSR